MSFLVLCCECLQIPWGKVSYIFMLFILLTEEDSQRVLTSLCLLCTANITELRRQDARWMVSKADPWLRYLFLPGLCTLWVAIIPEYGPKIITQRTKDNIIFAFTILLYFFDFHIQKVVKPEWKNIYNEIWIMSLFSW